MGHAFQDTIMDALIRYRRMRGFDTLWQPGMDHAGIATQMVVERQLNAAGQSRARSRARGFHRTRVGMEKHFGRHRSPQQLRRLGASVDWKRDKFTMDPELSQAVTEAFVRLYQEGLIYRGKRLVNWDPVLKTALSDLEVVPRRRRAVSGISSTPCAMAAAISSSRPRGRKPCWATPPSRFIPTMSAIGI